MKIGIIGGEVGMALAQALLARAGVEAQEVQAKEVAPEQTVAVTIRPMATIYESPFPYPEQRFGGYMKRTHRKRPR